MTTRRLIPTLKTHNAAPKTLKKPQRDSKQLQGFKTTTERLIRTTRKQWPQRHQTRWDYKETTISLMRHKSSEFVLCLCWSDWLLRMTFKTSVPKSPLSTNCRQTQDKQRQQVETVGWHQIMCFFLHVLQMKAEQVGARLHQYRCSSCFNSTSTNQTKAADSRVQ